jgi:hypothetical protein
MPAPQFTQGSMRLGKLSPYFAFDAERKAREFEFYLKSGSGRAFANKRFW